MTQVPILSGVLAGRSAEFRTSYPVNLEPVLVDNRIGKGQLRIAPGATTVATGPGLDRGGTVWNGRHYRVMGTTLVRLDGDAPATLGTVGGTGYVAFDASFDRLAIASGGALFYWNGTTLSQVTDPDLGTVIDMLWVDGYFMTTDGSYVVVTQLDDPTQVKPLKYGSAEDSPDPITGLVRIPGSNDTHIVGRYTIQVFQNVGGAGFPFKSVPGATIPFGCVSAAAKALFGKSFAFVGGAQGEGLGVYIAGQGDANKISTRAVDQALADVTDIAAIRMESRVYEDELRLFVHLPGETWVFLARGSERAQEPLWFRCRSGVGQPYRVRNAVLVGSRWIVGDLNSSALGVLDEATTDHFGEVAEWRFDAGLIYLGGVRIVHSVELIGLPGRGGDSAVFLSYTKDGETFSMERSVKLTRGRRDQRIAWRPHVRVSRYLGLRFRGYGEALAGFAACEVA